MAVAHFIEDFRAGTASRALTYIDPIYASADKDMNVFMICTMLSTATLLWGKKKKTAKPSMSFSIDSSLSVTILPLRLRSLHIGVADCRGITEELITFQPLLGTFPINIARLNPGCCICFAYLLVLTHDQLNTGRPVMRSYWPLEYQLESIATRKYKLLRSAY